jgi:hypothetical protein
MDHRNEEDALAQAIETHIRAHGVGDARTTAKVALAALGQFRANEAKKAALAKQAAASAPPNA